MFNTVNCGEHSGIIPCVHVPCSFILLTSGHLRVGREVQRSLHIFLVENLTEKTVLSALCCSFFFLIILLAALVLVVACRIFDLHIHCGM